MRSKFKNREILPVVWKMASKVEFSQRKALMGEDDATMVFETSKEVSVVTTFDQMNIREDLLRGIFAYGISAQCTRLVRQ